MPPEYDAQQSGSPLRCDSESRALYSLLGFTLFELLLAVTIAGLLLGVAYPSYLEVIKSLDVKQAIADIKKMENIIERYQSNHGTLPASLADIGGAPIDPWGNPYRYLNISTASIGKVRKDHNLVPLNTDYDLYSMGEDGKTSTPLPAKPSQDDVVRANNGGFIGLGEDY